MGKTDRLHVAIASPEIGPFAKTGGLADMVGSLAIALERLNIKVSMIMPAYRQVLTGGFLHEQVGTFHVPVAEDLEEGEIWRTKTGEDITVYFIRADRYYDRDFLYATPEGDYPDNARRFIFFSRAVLEVLRMDPPHVLHCHDWQSALSIVFLKTQPEYYPELKDTKTVLTIHNMGYQGIFWNLDWPLLNLDGRYFAPPYLEFFGKINFLKGGMIFADMLTTVSPTYAEEIKGEQGYGLEGVLRQRASDLVGILNGVDYNIWNPEIDPHIACNYSLEDPSGKRKCKEDLQRIFGLPIREDVPLIGMITRLTAQKGIDLLQQASPRLFKRDLQMVILGSGEKHYHSFIEALPAQYPGKAGVKLSFDEVLAHKIEAGADMFLMPSRYEPSGLNQLYSLKYGTIPVVRATGGLKDSIKEFNKVRKTGNGFLFKAYTPHALIGAVDRAISIFHQKDKWNILMKNAMGEDFSWDKSAKEYVAVYKKVLRRT